MNLPTRTTFSIYHQYAALQICDIHLLACTQAKSQQMPDVNLCQYSIGLDVNSVQKL